MNNPYNTSDIFGGSFNASVHYDAVKVQLASPETIRGWSHGEVKNPETINYQMAASIKRHIDFAAGYRPQLITFIYIRDLVKAVYLAIEKPVADRCYFVSEPQGYDSRAFSDYIQKEMGVKRVLHIKAPLWVLKAVSYCAGYIARLTGKPATLNSDKYKIMKHGFDINL